MAKQLWKPGNMLYPLPAVMVSCARQGERPNIITLAWVGTVCTNPPMVSISLRPSRYSYDLIRETGEFVINLTTTDLARAADYCGVRSGRDMDKFEDTGLTPEPSWELITAPGILESPVNMECRVSQVLELGSHHLFLAQVVCVHVEDRFLKENGKLDLAGTGLVCYSHGEYFSLGEKCGSFGYSVRKAEKMKKTGKAEGQKRSGKTEKANGQKQSGKTEKANGLEKGNGQKSRGSMEDGKGWKNKRREKQKGQKR